MKNVRILTLLFLFALIFVSTGCASTTPTPAPVSEKPVLATDSVATDAPVTEPAVTETAMTIVIAGPATPSSIPLILAAEKMGNATVQIIPNNSQANTSFLRGEINFLASGLSVGVDLRKNGAPVQAVNTYVTGLSYLVTYGEKVSSLSELKGQEIYLPFEGSPIEEATMFLAQKEGLNWGTDLKPVYSPFDASVALLKEGKARAVVLPEPFVTLVEKEPNIFISMDYYASWNEATGTQDGYPQVGTFVNADWAKQNPEQVAAFNAAMAEAIQFIAEHPEEAVAKVKDNFKLPEAVLLRSIQRTHFSLLTGDALQAGVEGYYNEIGKPLDDSFTDFYFPAK
jgi:ABC-type nitrate/sulfonate/bicarbonate transport system substrate-binding protein